MKENPICEWCGDQFTVLYDKGPTPRWCKPSHRQRSWEAAHALDLWKAPPELEPFIAAGMKRLGTTRAKYLAAAIKQSVSKEKP